MSYHSFYMRKWRRNNPHYYTEVYRLLFAELRKSFGGKCVVCKTVEKLEFAHVKPTSLSSDGRGLKNRYYDIKNHPDCYILMCFHHHHEFDRISPEIKEEWLKNNRVE